jgi:uroporphyrinogen-III synthase
VKSIVAGLGTRAEMLDRVVLAAIGPTTAAAHSEVGLRVTVVPATSTAVDLADALAAHLGPRPAAS